MRDGFGPRLRELREQAKLTQAELAERAGISLSGLIHLENGQRSPFWETVLLLADALGVSCHEFRKPAKPSPPRPRGRPRKERKGK